MNTLDIICQTAERILNEDPSPVVRIRLLRDVLRRPDDSQELVQAQQGLVQSRWAQELECEQWEDGSWGRLHSKDYRANQKIPTTEAGVERAIALGLDPTHPVLQKASCYLADVLESKVQPRDRAEKNDRWPTGVRLFAAATLAQIQPALTMLADAWNLWASIARRTFASGSYDADAEIHAHRELTGASVKDSYLVIDNKYALTLLGSRADALPPKIEAALLHWIWHKRNGIRYLGEEMSRPPCRVKAGPCDRWFASHELLSRFPSWRVLAPEVIQWLWDQRTPEGLWDLGARSAFSATLSLSESWRKRNARQFDWTTRVLVLLQLYHTRGVQCFAHHWQKRLTDSLT